MFLLRQSKAIIDEGNKGIKDKFVCVCDLHLLYTTSKVLLKDISSLKKIYQIHMLKLKTIALFKKIKIIGKKSYYDTKKVFSCSLNCHL